MRCGSRARRSGPGTAATAGWPRRRPPRGVGIWDGRSCGAGSAGPAANAVRLKVKWNANGDDGGNLNGEWVRITNTDPLHPLRLARVVVPRLALRRYLFPSGAVVLAGGSIRLRIGEGTNARDTFTGASRARPSTTRPTTGSRRATAATSSTRTGTCARTSSTRAARPASSRWPARSNSRLTSMRRSTCASATSRAARSACTSTRSSARRGSTSSACAMSSGLARRWSGIGRPAYHIQNDADGSPPPGPPPGRGDPPPRNPPNGPPCMPIGRTVPCVLPLPPAAGASTGRVGVRPRTPRRVREELGLPPPAPRLRQRRGDAAQPARRAGRVPRLGRAEVPRSVRSYGDATRAHRSYAAALTLVAAGALVLAGAAEARTRVLVDLPAAGVDLRSDGERFSAWSPGGGRYPSEGVDYSFLRDSRSGRTRRYTPRAAAASERLPRGSA